MYEYSFFEYIVSVVCHMNREYQKLIKKGLLSEENYYLFDKFNQSLMKF